MTTLVGHNFVRLHRLETLVMSQLSSFTGGSKEIDDCPISAVTHAGQPHVDWSFCVALEDHLDFLNGDLPSIIKGVKGPP